MSKLLSRSSVLSSIQLKCKKAKAATGLVAARMDVDSTETCRSYYQIIQMSLLRRTRHCTPVAEGKPEAAEVGIHLVFHDKTFSRRRATASIPALRGPRIRRVMERLATCFGLRLRRFKREACIISTEQITLFCG
jgi:hypothetical protein